mgnify:CR=1 FL=1
MNVQELGDANVAFVREVDALDEIARVAQLSHRAVARRVNGAHGGTLVRTLFGPEWPSQLDEMGLTFVRDAGGGAFATRLSRATGLLASEVRERLAAASR